MDIDFAKGAVEAILFASGEPVAAKRLAEVLDIELPTIQRVLTMIADECEKPGRGTVLLKLQDSYQLATKNQFAPQVRQALEVRRNTPLSQAAMETLAIVAYLQPVTRSGVASVRGVNSDSSINSLVEKGLVREAGVADAPGNPALYATTRAFLEKFGLRSTADLPDLDQFAPDDDTRAFIRERLSATREDAFVADDARLDGDEADPLDGVRFELDDEGPGSIAESPREEAASDAAQQMLAEAMASGFGLVEKIDFDNLTFETDDE